MELNCVKSVHIGSFSGLHFPAFGMNTGQENSETDSFYAVLRKLIDTFTSNILSDITRKYIVWLGGLDPKSKLC